MIKTIIKLLSLLSIVAYVGANGEELQGYLCEPVKGTQCVAAAVELKNLQKSLVSYYLSADRVLPRERFEGFVRQEFQSQFKSPIEDPWQNKYRYQPVKKGFKVLSDGPDRKRGTADDICLIWTASA